MLFVTAGLSLLPEEMANSLEVYQSWRPLNSRTINTANLAEGALNNLARTLITEFKNHLAANFFSKFKQYLRARHCLDGATAHTLLQQIYGFSPAVPSGERGFNPLVHYWKERLPALPSKAALFANPTLFLPLFHHFQKFLHRRDEFPELKQWKSFSLLPHKAGFKASFFRIDTNTLHGLLQVVHSILTPAYELGRLNCIAYMIHVLCFVGCWLFTTITHILPQSPGCTVAPAIPH